MTHTGNDVNPLVKIKALLNSLRPSEHKVAVFIKEHPNEIIYLNVVSLAEKCHVSQASVIRLCQALGYSGYHELKINLAKSIVEPVKTIHEELAPEDTVPTIVQKVLKANVQAIEDTLQILDIKSMEAAIKCMSKAQRIDFYGMGSSAIVAADARHQFFKIGKFCASYSDPHVQAMSASTLKKGDVVLGISHSGSSKDLLESLEIASKAGATVICITSSANSPITELSDISLIVVSKEQYYKTEPMTSLLAQLSIVDALSVGVAMANKDQAISTLQKTRASISNKRF